MSHIGDRIYNIRKTEKALTQQELIDNINTSHNMNISRNMLSNWERGKQTPSIDAIYALSDALGVTCDYLIKGKKKEETPAFCSVPVAENRLAPESVRDIYTKAERYFSKTKEDTDFIMNVDINNMINAGIKAGDLVEIHRQSTLCDGDIGLFMIGGFITLKRYYSQKGKIILVDECAGARPEFIDSLEKNNICLLGKAISIIRDLV